MGRGRKGVLSQSAKKEDGKWLISEKDKQVFIFGATKGKQKVAVMPEDVLNELRQIDPREKDMRRVWDRPNKRFPVHKQKKPRSVRRVHRRVRAWANENGGGISRWVLQILR